VAQLRYAVHTLGFDECNHWQKLWALYTAGHAAAHLEARVAKASPLRVDWLVPVRADLGITLLPGRRDYGRDLASDLAALREAGATHLLTLLSADELADYGAEALPERAREAGFVWHGEALLDQQPMRREQMERVARWLDGALAANGHVVVHCVAGLGRSGMVAASYLARSGMSAGAAIALVRERRSPRAVETPAQEEFVHRYAQERQETAG
jgi:protein-tyrosine phosphatase